LSQEADCPATICRSLLLVAPGRRLELVTVF